MDGWMGLLLFAGESKRGMEKVRVLGPALASGAALTKSPILISPRKDHLTAICVRKGSKVFLRSLNRLKG